MKFADSDFIISVLRGSQKVMKKLDEFNEEQLATTSINEFEVLYGAVHNGKLDEVAQAKKFFERLKIFEFDGPSAQIASKLHSQLTKQGNRIDFMDLFIASIVLANNGTLVTRNKKHFDRIPGLEIEEW